MPSNESDPEISNNKGRKAEGEQEIAHGNTPKCGIIMPISAIDGCSDSHWADVLQILEDTIQGIGFDPSLVSSADDVGLIHKRIIQNLYDNPIVVCDVSGKNPNVMFELGMRLAFDRPTIIVKDDKTSYSFDTAPIEHLEYPRDLRFSQIILFKKILSAKIKATYESLQKDKDFTTFLKHFGQFKVAKLDERIVSPDEYILDEIKSIRQLILRGNREFFRRPITDLSTSISPGSDINQIKIRDSIIVSNIESINEFCDDLNKEIKELHGVIDFSIVSMHDEIKIDLTADTNKFNYHKYLEILHKKYREMKIDRKA